MNDYLCNFPAKVMNVLLSCTHSSVNIRCYWTNSNVALSQARPINAHFTLSQSDFIAYNVPDPVRMVFSLKEFKASLWYAERLGLPITARFDRPGKPVIFTIEETGLLIADFAVTTRAESEIPTTHTTTATDSLLSFTSVSGFSHQTTPTRQPPSLSREASTSSSNRPIVPTQPYNTEEDVDDEEPLFKESEEQRRLSLNKRKGPPSMKPRPENRNKQHCATGRTMSGSATLDMLEPLFCTSEEQLSGGRMREASSDNPLFAFGSPQSSTGRQPQLNRSSGSGSGKQKQKSVAVDDGDSTDDGTGDLDHYA
ncbi:cell cycle checkpoint control protein rad9a [Apophysomyces sp. BC1015]|nr:cell cycle checkpoint control protein rad9a [Apophysomyces sp. BC1015]